MCVCVLNRNTPCGYDCVEQFDTAFAALKISLLEESGKKGIQVAMKHAFARCVRVPVCVRVCVCVMRERRRWPICVYI